MVSRDEAHEAEEEHGGRHQGSTGSRRQHSEHSAHDDDGRHSEKLDSGSDHVDEDHLMRGRAENVSMDELPASLLQGVVFFVVPIVLSNVTTDGADDGDTEESGQREHDDDRVEDAEPVDVDGLGGEVDVPARGPDDVGFLEGDRVGEVDGLLRIAEFRVLSVVGDGTR